MKHINWFKSNALIAAALFLLLFIPLYPKLPLFDVVQTWVYIRLEDFLVLLADILLVWHLVRRESSIKSPLTIPIVTYLGVALVSLAIALIFIFPRFSGVLFPHLAILHFARRFEYMSLFFLMYAGLSRRTGIKAVITVLSISSIVIVIYGFGQKLWGWPAFLTMNEEFAKGAPLRLPPTARIPSTFGGHYDLAAYLVFIIPLFANLAIAAGGWVKKLFFAAVALGLYVLLLLTASRVSFGVYLIAISVMLIWQKKPWLILPVVIVSFLLLNSVNSASERFYKTFRYSDVIVDISTGRPVGTLESLEGGTAVIKSQERPDVESLPQGSEFIGVPVKPQGGTQTVGTVEIIKTNLMNKGTGEIATVSGSFLIQKALVYDISITTRFQGEWPKAIEAFKRNIVTGSGFSSLNVAVDGDYMRMLGETGIAGTIAFLGIFAYLFYWFFKVRKKMDDLSSAFVTGIMAGLIGLFLNAVLIDVFEASKVAFIVWLLTGAAVAVLVKFGQPPLGYFRFLKKLFTHEASVYVYIAIAVWIVYGAALGMYFMGDDFTWLKWAASSSWTDLFRYFTDSRGFFYRPVPKLWYFVQYQFFWLKPVAYHVMSLSLYTAIVLFVYALMRRMNVRRVVSIIIAVWFLLLSVHHENVYWISGASSLLSTLFLLGAVYIVVKPPKSGLRGRVAEIMAVSALTLLSMLSYDGMIVAPLVVWLLFMTYRRCGILARSWILIVLPIYLLMRSVSGALGPSGDYAVNMSKLAVNAAGNLTGYFAAMAGGLRVFEAWGSLRGFLRSSARETGIAVAVFGAAVAYAVFKNLRRLTPYREAIVFAVLSVLTLAAYAGLGNMSERYALPASALAAVSLGLVSEKIISVRKGAVAVFLAVIIISAAINFRDLKKAESDWRTASRVSEQTLLSMRNAFFPLISNTEFVFVNVPIRYGRAWIFPTGLDDAMWHIFRLNPYWYRVFTSPSVEDALAHPRSRPMVAWYVLFFDKDLNLNRISVNLESSGKKP